MKTTSAVISMIVVAVICIGGTTLYFKQQAQNQSSTQATSGQANATALIKKATAGHAVVLNNFIDGPFQGFVLKGTEPNSPEGILFTDMSGNYLISGNVMDKNLKSLTEAAYDKYISPAKAQQAFQMIDKTNYVVMGSDQAPHKLYVLADPNCVFCHEFYTASKPYVASGQLQIRWILGAFLKSSSAGRAAAILGASDPAAAFAQNENGFITDKEEGGITPMANISPELKAKIQTNMNFMMKNQFMQTPTLLYKNTQGVASLYMGLPDATQLKALINGMSNKY